MPPTDPISLDVHGPRHFTARFARPGRIEVTVTEAGEVIAHVYEGPEDDLNDEPLGAFDSTVGQNVDWAG